mmetsp:Transcript_10049/g.23494  ORF Transcript_10049/g.23494 Transcript_10049/m.23494 type:complete len:178 (+) Transcript_10049:211-744(+)
MREARAIPHLHPGVSRQQSRHEGGRWRDNERRNGKQVRVARSLLSEEAALARLRGTSESSWRNERMGGNSLHEMYNDDDVGYHPIRQAFQGGGQEFPTTAGLNRSNARDPSVTQNDKANHFDDDEENVIVLCDTSHCCNEGAKNLCTIALWGMITLAIFNRFLVHFAGFLQHTPNKE